MTTAQLGDSGIVLGEVDAFGVEWRWHGDDPWSPGPAPRTVSGERAGDHGAWDSTEFYGSRTWALEGVARTVDHTALHQAKRRFMSAINLGFDLRVIEPGFDRTARFRRDGQPLWSELTPSLAKFSASLIAPDPRIYSAAIKSAHAGFPSTVGGLTWPVTWPATWDAVTTSGDMPMVNEGDQTAWPIFRIDGPVQEPVIVNAATGEAMHIDLTLAAGEWITLDTGTHQVLANGDPNASRRDRFFGQWWGLPEGASTARFFGASAGVGAQLSATWRDTWI